MPRPLSIAAGLFFFALSAAPAAASGPFQVHFESGSATLDAHDERILDHAAQWLREALALMPGTRHVHLEAGADRVGSAASNRWLSLRRGEAVKRALMRRGFARGEIDIEPLGEGLPIVETAGGVAEPQNRVVTLMVEPGPAQASEHRRQRDR